MRSLCTLENGTPLPELEYNCNKKVLASQESAQILNFPAPLLDSPLQNSALPCFGSVLKKRGKIQNLSIFQEGQNILITIVL